MSENVPNTLSKPAITPNPAQKEAGESSDLKELVTEQKISINDDFADYKEEEDEDYQDEEEESTEEEGSEDEREDSEEYQVDPKELEELVKTAVDPLADKEKAMFLDPTVKLLRDGKKIPSPIKDGHDIETLTNKFKTFTA
ncbi:hypothetical protein G9A89_010666 [Geosiphon pyriformis]|nr:hypothetical protein G9A89_010666 [Geosiphon pyriformis]